MATTTLKVTGMSCEHCVHAVTDALQDTAGVRRAEVDLKGGRVVVDYDENKTSPRVLANVVVYEGYSVEETT